MRQLLICLCLFAMILPVVQGQVSRSGPFREVSLKIDTSIYLLSKNTIQDKGETMLYFQYNDVDAVAEVELTPNSPQYIKSLELLPSGDYSLVDSLLWINDQFRFKLRFRQLTQSDFLQFTFKLQWTGRSEPSIVELKLFPVTETSAFLDPQDNKLFIGEERVFKVETNRPLNIRYFNQWTKNLPINYKFSVDQGELRIHLLPTKPGLQVLEAPVRLRKPFLSPDKRPIYELPPLHYEFEVKESKLVFLNTNKKEVSLNRNNPGEAIEIELDYHPSLKLKKTYRLEAQQEEGGALVAEIFTQSTLANGRMLCTLRTYNNHRQSEGYLFIKDGDVARYITNFDITPAMRVTGMSVLSAKGNMSSGQTIYPGESVEIKLQGDGLHKARFSFEGLAEVRTDTLVKGENEVVFLAKVPLDIKKSSVELLNNGKPIGQSLKVKEFQTPHPLNFIELEIEGQEKKPISEIDKTIFIDHTLDDVVLAFHPERIDEGQRLFGKQYLIVDIQVTNNNTLLDKRTLEKVVICPGDNSPRFDQYDRSDCQVNNISLNQLLRRKTFDLDEWSTIEITVRHDPQHHSGQGFSQKTEIILRRYTSFDLDVSFPAGLLTKTFGQDGFGTLNGVSMAIIAQFSFYHPRRIAKYRPYKFGVGFLALNAFNFSENNTSRDVGVVVLGSLYSLQNKARKLSFPLYLGAGYFLSEKDFFYLLGPGIRVQL
ncbi:MAG: hypothetical protein GC192_16265 [Bacteroidetes bacterium]|nr:hypothetical protein [Bacteroidota bacterium]